MNKNYMTLAAVGIGIVILTAGGFFFLNQNSTTDTDSIEKMATEDKMIEEDTHMDDDTIKEKDEDAVMMEASSSKYITHSAGIVEDTNGSERVLYFYANWCPTCRPVDTELNENADQLPDDISVIRVNYNDPETDEEEEALAENYNVTYQHTFVHIDEDGDEISTWSGGGLEELLEQI